MCSVRVRWGEGSVWWGARGGWEACRGGLGVAISRATVILHHADLHLLNRQQQSTNPPTHTHTPPPPLRFLVPGLHLCREFRDAARVMGNTALFQQMEAASAAIKRDVIFAASLYLA